MENIITYVGMDTHKNQHKIAIHFAGQEEIAEFTVKNTDIATVRELAGFIWAIMTEYQARQNVKDAA
jgi:hypothetical protein